MKRLSRLRNLVAAKGYGNQWLVLWLSVLVVACALQFSGLLQRWDLLAYDLCTPVISPQPSREIAIIAIDDRSIEALGRWPWPRSIHARLIKRLTSIEPKSVGFSLIFSEPEAGNLHGDFLLAKALAANGKVVLPVLHQADPNQPGAMAVQLPLPELTEAAAGLAHLDVELDPDGHSRGLFLRAGLGYPAWSALALAMLEVGGDWSPADGLPGLRNPNLESASSKAWVRDYFVLTPWAGPPGSFRTVSYIDVLNDPEVLAQLSRKHLLVGVNASGLGGELATPIARLFRPMAAVEFHANVLNGLLANRLMVPVSTFWGTLMSILLISLSFPAFTLPTPHRAMAALFSMVMVTVVLSLAMLTLFNRWWSPTMPLLGLFLSFLGGSWYRLDTTLKQLNSAKEKAEITVRSIADGVISTDRTGRVDFMNEAAEQLTGFRMDDARGQPLAAIFRLQDESGRPIPIETVLENSTQKLLNSGEEQTLLIGCSSQKHVVQVSANLMKLPDGSAGGMVLAFSDISKTKNLVEKLAYQAHHDELTGLPNRTLLMDRLNHAIAHASRVKEKIAVLFIDLDNFKKINDGLGHSSGDALLMAVAERFKGLIRKTDTVARLGGDEFIILFENLNYPGGAGMLARKLLDILARPFVIDQHKIYLSCSIGISEFPKDGRDVETLLKNADIAMYRAKEKGRNNFQFFSQSMNDRILEQLNLEKALRHALENETLELFYQPQVHLTSGRIVGVEALLRWQHPELGFVSPAKMISMAEETGLIHPLGEWVLHKACEQIKAWKTQYPQPLTMAINLSPRQFNDGSLLEKIRQIILRTGIAPELIKLEITEGVVLHDFQHASKFLKQFRDMGGSVAIDDFGTGYSSLSYIRQIPADQLKIDRSFIVNIDRDSRAAAITLAIVSMAHGVGLQVVAEGVENKVQLDILKVQRCDQVQGYFFSRPLPADRIEKMISVNFDTRISQHL